RRHTSFSRDWSSDVCSSDLAGELVQAGLLLPDLVQHLRGLLRLQLDELGLELRVEEDRIGRRDERAELGLASLVGEDGVVGVEEDRKSVVVGEGVSERDRGF